MRHLIKNTVLIFSALMLGNSVHAQVVNPFVINPATLQWSPVRDLPPGAEVVVLSGNPEKKEPFVARLKLPADYYVPVHHHPVNEYDTVLSGTLYLGVGSKKDLSHREAIPAGGFAMIPAKLEHSTWTKEATVIQVSGIGPWGMIYNKHESKQS